MTPPPTAAVVLDAAYLDDTTRIEQPPESMRDKRRLVPAGTALLIILVALTTGLLLNARSLQQTAENQPLGSPVRTVTVALIRPVAAISTFLKLDTPHDTIDQALGRTSTTPPEEPAAVAPSEGSDNEVAAPTTTLASVTTTEPTSGIQATVEDPLEVYVVSDSFGQTLGPSLVNVAPDTGLIDIEYDFRISSGLMRPDFFDWPAHATARLAEVDPDVTIAMFGGNDGQETFAEGALQDIGSPVWIEVYSGRVAEMMDLLSAGSERVYWIGLPIAGSAEHAEKFELMNSIYEAEAAERDNVTYIDIWGLFQDENGQYAAFLRDENGDLVEMRAADDIHFVWPGAERLARVILDQFDTDWGTGGT